MARVLPRVPRRPGSIRFCGVAQKCYEAPMVKEVTLRKAGGSIAATLPKEMADRLHLEPGDRALVVETENGILLTPITAKLIARAIQTGKVPDLLRPFWPS